MKKGSKQINNYNSQAVLGNKVGRLTLPSKTSQALTVHPIFIASNSIAPKNIK